MKIRRMIGLSFFCVSLLLLSGCSLGKKTVLTYDGSFELVLGKTTAGEVLEAGFTDRYSHSGKTEIDGWSWENLYAMKGDLTYGAMYAGNKSSGEIDFEKGKIFRVVIDYDDDTYATGDVLINGVNYAGYTRDQIKDAMDYAEMTLDSDKFLVFEYGKFKYSFQFAEGTETLVSISIDDGTEWELVLE